MALQADKQRNFKSRSFAVPFERTGLDLFAGYDHSPWRFWLYWHSVFLFNGPVRLKTLDNRAIVQVSEACLIELIQEIFMQIRQR